MSLYCYCKKCDYNVDGTCYAEPLEISLEGECMNICIIEFDEKEGDSDTPWIDDDSIPNEDMRPDNEVM